jgi:hypothetical protein
MNRVRSLIALLVLLPALGSAADPIADLQQRIKSGQAKLAFDTKHGYLGSLLKTLNVPISSQTLIFSKTSLQSEGISPKAPRALYFNDDVYVAWVQGASSIEIMSIDPKRGAMFYGLAQENDGRPEFELITGHICSACHHVSGLTKFVPRLLFSSVIPDESGGVEGTYPVQTTDESPMEERWGGWYVTGTHGAQRHLGNIVLKTPVSPLGNLPRVDFSKSSNLKDLSKLLDTSRYLSPHSDIVALMVLAHQLDIHNLIALAGAKPEADPKESGEPLVRAMLFSGAAPLKEPVSGTSAFTKEFSDRGPRDKSGRSLRELDLKTRLFRYPLSYMIYTNAFDEMSENVKAYVYRRLVEVLTGKDQSRNFAHLSNSDRQAILEIVRETKIGFPKP